MTTDGTSAARLDALRLDGPQDGPLSVPPQASRSPVTNIAIRGRRLSRPTTGARKHEALDSACVLPAFVAGPENQLVSRVIGALVDSGSLMEDSKKAGTTEETPAPFSEHAKPSGPITLVGPSGCGKTHLAHGLAELWHKSFSKPTTGAAQRSKKRGVAYLTASDFTRQLADAIEDGAVNEFRDQLRGCGLLVIDDLDRISSAGHVQEELLHTVDALTESGGLMIFATATLPVDTAGMGRSLVSRLSEGLLLEIAPLGVEARSELLRQVTMTLNCRLDDEALSTLASRLPGEPPLLLSAGVELRRRFGPKIDATDAARFLEDKTNGSSPALRDILVASARYFGVTQKMLTSASRKQTVVLARAVAVYLARRLTPLSYQEIGRALGGRDHTTILHNFRRIERALTKDRALQSAIEDLQRSM